MFKNDRFSRILDLLQKKKVMSTNELQEQLYVSNSTLRRDLIELEKMGKISRKFGHVELIRSDNIELSYLFRKQENGEAKKYIADIASMYLGDNQSVFIDSSSTTSFLAPYFEDLTNVVVITNGLRLAVELDEVPNVKTFIAGGRLRVGSGSILGDVSLDYFDNFRADLVFLSCSSINAYDIYMSSEEQSSIKRKMMMNADKTILLCDNSKFDVKGYYKLCDVQNVDVIILDRQPPEDILKIWQTMNIEILF
jgi:DeoR/GlpR family transcriptional regulator of sugar metabolism